MNKVIHDLTNKLFAVTVYIDQAEYNKAEAAAKEAVRLLEQLRRIAEVLGYVA